MLIDQETFILIFKIINTGVIAILFRTLFVKYARPALRDFKQQEAVTLQGYAEKKKHLDLRQITLDNRSDEQEIQALHMQKCIDQWRVVVAQERKERIQLKEQVRQILAARQVERSQLLRLEHARRHLLPSVLKDTRVHLVTAFSTVQRKQEYVQSLVKALKEGT